MENCLRFHRLPSTDPDKPTCPTDGGQAWIKVGGLYLSVAADGKPQLTDSMTPYTTEDPFLFTWLDEATEPYPMVLKATRSGQNMMLVVRRTTCCKSTYTVLFQGGDCVEDGIWHLKKISGSEFVVVSSTADDMALMNDKGQLRVRKTDMGNPCMVVVRLEYRPLTQRCD